MKQGFLFPEKARVDRVLSKIKLYQQISASAALKRKFVEKIEKIIWSYKLAPETLALPTHGAIQEIQVFTLQLKFQQQPSDILQTLDKAIPSPLIFMLCSEDEQCWAAAYKRPNPTEPSKAGLSTYFYTPWSPPIPTLQPLPPALHLAGLYHQLLAAFLPLQARSQEDLPALIERCETLSKQCSVRDTLSLRLQREKQFHRKVSLNQELRHLNQTILALQAP